MKAFRNVAGTVVEIEVDVDPNGAPILPPDTTVSPRPEALADHYVTVVDREWVQIPIPRYNPSFETIKSQALAKFKEYREWYINQTVTYDGYVFDCDELARSRLTQALTINMATSSVPPGWVTYDNRLYPLADVAQLQGLIAAVQTAFQTRFFEMTTLRDQITSATNAEELAAITIPSIPSEF